MTKGLANLAARSAQCLVSIGAAVVALVITSGCAAGGVRPEQSTLGCARTIIETQVPMGLGDKQRHCLAAGLIAQQCSPIEANLLALAKETRDLFGTGDAEWADWQADRTGIRCARGEGAVAACCASALAPGLRE